MGKKKIYLGIIIISIILIIVGIVLSFIQKENPTNNERQIYKEKETVTIDYIKITLNDSGEYTNYKKCEDDDSIIDGSPTFSLDTNCTEILSDEKIQKFSFELRGLKDNQLINSTNFKCIADDKEYNQVYGLDESEFSYSLKAGENKIGNIYCKIPKSAKNIKIKYQKDDNSSIFFEV